MPPIPSRAVSGRYRGRHDRVVVELRVDVDGPRPTRRVSADYWSAPTGEPMGSMRVEQPTIRSTASHVVITGTGSFTWSTPQRQIRITIARAAAGAPPPPATLAHLASDGRPGATYPCGFESPWFRTVRLEEAVQRGVTKFDSYDTAALPSGGPPRTLSYVEAFAEAGIEMRVAGAPARVDTTAAGADAAWSDAELHAAMAERFRRWIGHPGWAVWLMHATRHDNLGLDGPHDGGMQGIMFDQLRRQGCAVFYDVMPGTAPADLRAQLFTCVHEVAHGFNLRHAWERSPFRPPIPSRPATASWMNYPYLYPGGRPAFWSTFAFEFDDDELAHLRHALLDDVVMGATPFQSDAALMRGPDGGDPADADGGLRLTLTMPPSVAYGVPVTADLALSVTAREGRLVQTVLGPRSGTVDLAIGRVGETPHVFEPLLRHCRGGVTVLRTPSDPSVRDGALVHYGKDGFPFRMPGLYDVQARYAAADGRHVLSQPVRVRVLAPRTPAEDAVGKLTFGDDQTGALLSLMGSDAPALRRGNSALQRIIGRFPTHPMAAIARLVLGTNAVRTFKTIADEGPVHVRPSQPAAARALVDPVIDVDRLDRAAARAPADVGRREAMAIALAQVGTRPGIAPAVGAFLRSRIGEFAIAAPAMAAAGAGRSSLDPPPGGTIRRGTDGGPGPEGPTTQPPAGVARIPR
jgi:hypothetical protein